VGKDIKGYENAMEMEEGTRASGISRSRHKMDKGK